MDYLKQSTMFKIRKVLRYVSLYGMRRTYLKIMGQLHTRRKFEVLPENRNPQRKDAFVGLIGCGNYAFTTIAYYLRRKYGNVIAVAMDSDINRAASLSKFHRIPLFTTDAEEVIKNDLVKLVYIASFHSSHAEYAIQALESGKHVYIEKPHIVTRDQLVRLIDTIERTNGKVFLGFNRPGSRFGRVISDYLGREEGPSIFNWFIAGHDLEPDHWYFRKEEGGRILGNLCHWTDFVLRLVPPEGAYPVTITPTRAESSDSDIAVTYCFHDGTIAVITFSAKGHAFEGVKERFAAYRGNCMVTMDDFESLKVEVVHKRIEMRNRLRDHGHQRNIILAAESVKNNLADGRGENIAHIWNTGLLFLETKRALDGRKTITVDSFENRVAIPDLVHHRMGHIE